MRTKTVFRKEVQCLLEPSLCQSLTAPCWSQMCATDSCTNLAVSSETLTEHAQGYNYVKTRQEKCVK